MSRRKLPGDWITRADGSKAWRLPYRTPDGRQTSKVFDTKGAAGDFLADLQVGTRDGTWVALDAGRERLVDFGRQWGEIEAAAEHWQPGTVESFGYHLQRIERLVGDMRLDEADQLVLKRLQGELGARYASSSITMSYAKRIMLSAFHTGRIRRDVTVGVTASRRNSGDDRRVGPDDVPTREELLAVVAAAQPKYRAAIALGACGLRVSEMLGVTVDRLDVERRVLVVDRQLVRVDGRPTFKLPKREKTRTIELPTWAILELRRHLRDHGPFWPMKGSDGDLVFRGGRDAPLRRDAFYDSVWRPALVAAGLTADRYVFHSLRHWCASTLLAAGAPVPAVAGYLGDVPETVMRTYAHWLRDDRSLPATLLDQTFVGASTERVVTRT